MGEIVFADCETDNFVPDLSTMWLLQLATGVDGEVECFSDYDDTLRPLSVGLSILREADKVVFHNAFGFDFFAINQLYPGTLRVEQTIDSLIISRLMDSRAKRHALKDLGEALGFSKGEWTDFSRYQKGMIPYGIRDVQILQRAWKGTAKVRSFGDFYAKYRQACEWEFETAYVIQKQELHGFRLDVRKAQLLESELRQENEDTKRGLQQVFPPIVHKRVSEKTGKQLKDKIEVFNPGSRDQIARRLIEKYEWEPLIQTPTGKPKIDEDVLASMPYPEAKLINEYMTIGKMLGQIADGKNAWLKLVRPDNYVYGYVNTLGARTHRMSHSGPNMAQVNTDPRMRAVWLPDEGEVLVGVDAEGLELRMLAHYLFAYDGGKYCTFVHSGDKKLETDVHSMNRKAAGLYLRDSAKTMIYAHNYGCFDKKLGIIVIDDARAAGMPIPKGTPHALGKALRGKIEVGIEGLGELIEKCKKQHTKRGAMIGLDGRYIPSASDHSALNTLLQGNGSIVMKVALCLFDREVARRNLHNVVGYCANVHDEFQVSCPREYAEEVAEIGKWSIAEAGRVLNVRCPLVGDAKIGNNWKETH